MKIVAISASLSENSSTDQLGHKIGEAIMHELPGAEFEVIGLRGLAHNIMDAMLTGFPSPQLEEAFRKVEVADGVVALTPAYNASMSGLFKSFFDVLPEDVMRGKPTLLGATGGTPRHSLVTDHAMRPLFAYLHATIATTAVFAATEDWGAQAADSNADGGSTLARRIQRAATELAMIIRVDGGLMVPTDGHVTTADEAANHDEHPRKLREAPTEGKSAKDLLDMEPEDLYSDFQSFDSLMKGSK